MELRVRRLPPGTDQTDRDWGSRPPAGERAGERARNTTSWGRLQMARRHPSGL